MTQRELNELNNTIMSMLNDLANASDDFCRFLEKPSEGSWDDAHRSMRNWANDNEVDCLFCCGATKAVIISDELDYVVKMPLLWERVQTNWNPEKRDYDIKEWNETTDYCKMEWRNFALAHEQNLDSCFAATYYLGEFKSCPIYIQEKWECDEDYTSSQMYDSAWRRYCADEGITGEEDDFNEIEERFSDDFYDGDSEEQSYDFTYEMWGTDTADKFWSFCEEHMINDLHSANLTCWDDRLVVVDYSGFGDNSEAAFKDDEWCRNVLAA